MKRAFLILMVLTLVGGGLGFAAAVGFDPQSSSSSQDAKARVVDINRAGLEELMELPGIGEKVAQRIVSYREENGPFQKTEELMNVRGIGEKTYLKLRPMLTVSGGKS